MPEYLAPGVYVEETSYRSKSIEGVATSTAGFVGLCSYGPVAGPPRLITALEEFRRAFGSLDDLVFGGVRRTNYLGRAVRAFFENGGKRVYVSRVYVPTDASLHTGYGQGAIGISGQSAFWRARYPGAAGELEVSVSAVRGSDAVQRIGSERRLRALRPGDLVDVRTGAAASSGAVTVTDINELAWVVTTPQGELALENSNGAVALGLTTVVQKLSLTVTVGTAPGRVEQYSDLSTVPTSPNYLSHVMRTENATLGVDPPYDSAARVWFDESGIDPNVRASVSWPGLLFEALLTAVTLSNADDGEEISNIDGHLVGAGSAHSATGLTALAEVEDIAIVAAPDLASLADGLIQSGHNALISHCENLQYRVAILSAARGKDETTIRDVKAKLDSTHAALYFPWVTVQEGRGQTLDLPPDGFIAGIFARSDVERGVHKAPANEVVRGALRFSRHVTQGQQDVLNPEGVNCLRYFEGRGNRVWGARTISSDPEWKYLNVRRLFGYLEQSIERSTQWAVFEPNNESLWLKVRTTIESFLADVWRTGALVGATPAEAFFVRCDRTTMTQGDLDNGRLICLVGVAPAKPAEFVVFRIGQWTADASIV
jgi:Bacteriophage tail sheath protein